MRQVGGLGVHLARAIDDGSIVGPKIHGAGAMLSMTGGHGDLHQLSLPVLRALADTHPYLRVCDGAADCRRAVREMLREGARHQGARVRWHAVGDRRPAPPAVHGRRTGRDRRAHLNEVGAAGGVPEYTLPKLAAAGDQHDRVDV